MQRAQLPGATRTFQVKSGSIGQTVDTYWWRRWWRRRRRRGRRVRWLFRGLGALYDLHVVRWLRGSTCRTSWKEERRLTREKTALRTIFPNTLPPTLIELLDLLDELAFGERHLVILLGLQTFSVSLPLSCTQHSDLSYLILELHDRTYTLAVHRSCGGWGMLVLKFVFGLRLRLMFRL